MNYSELVTAIQEFLEDEEAEFATNIPRFVRNAEERIYRTVQIPALRRTVNGVMSASNRFLSLTDDFLSMYEIGLNNSGTWKWLDQKDRAFIREAYPDLTTEGEPNYYAIWDQNTIVLGPTPDQSYPVEMTYEHKPESIVDNSTTWLGSNCENVLLYGSLYEGYLFMKGDNDLMTQYENRYREEIAKLVELGVVRSKTDEYRGGRAA